MLTAKGFQLDIRKPRFGDPLPETMEEHAGAVIFGGPMSANDPDDFVKAETDWIGVTLKEGAPFLGVCLGAQMLVKHLGGAVTPHCDGCAEIGFYRLEATEAGNRLGEWPGMVYQWHREGFDLPAGRDAACPRRHFREPGIFGERHGLRHPVPQRADLRDGVPLDGARRRALYAAEGAVAA